MKLFIFILTSVLAASTFAADLSAKGTLDFRSVGGGFNAGLYEVSVEINSFAQKAEGYIERDIKRNDNDYFCVSTVKFPVGTLTYTFKNLENGDVRVEEMQLFAETSQADSGKACTLTNEAFVGEQTVYVSTTKNFVMPVKAPAGYDVVTLWLSPFYTLQLKADLSVSGKALTIDPQTLFAHASVFAPANYNFAKITYYLNAKQSSSILSLAIGTNNLTLTK